MQASLMKLLAFAIPYFLCADWLHHHSILMCFLGLSRPFLSSPHFCPVRFGRQRHTGQRTVPVAGGAVPAVGVGGHRHLRRTGCLPATLVQPAWSTPGVQPGQCFAAGLRRFGAAGRTPLGNYLKPRPLECAWGRALNKPKACPPCVS